LMRNKVQSANRKKEKDGQQDSPMVRGIQLWQWASGSKQLADGQPKDRPMERKKAVIKEICQKESMVEEGQSMIDDGSKSQF
jgi:hypothetical protein